LAGQVVFNAQKMYLLLFECKVRRNIYPVLLHPILYFVDLTCIYIRRLFIILLEFRIKKRYLKLIS